MASTPESEDVVVIDDEPSATDPRTATVDATALALDPKSGGGAAPAAVVVRQSTVVIRAAQVIGARQTTTVIARPAISAAAKQDPAPAGSANERRIHPPAPSSAGSVAAIDDGKALELDGFDPWSAAREADDYLRQGLQPNVVKAQSADILILGQRNGLLLWICLCEAVLLVAVAALVVYTAMTVPARAIPATAQVEVYAKVTRSSAQVKTFARFIAQEMESWAHWDASALPARILPFLDPEIRGPFEAKFSALARESQIYKGRQFFEVAELRYLGVVNETEHRVILFYRAYLGRGANTSAFNLDSISRRAKILVIGEVDTTAENDWGLRVISTTS